MTDDRPQLIDSAVAMDAEDAPISVRQEGPSMLYWVADWTGLLATVFLLGATLNSLFRWLPNNTNCDLGGMILSGIMAWLCFRLTLSSAASPRVYRRFLAGISLPCAWAVLLPLVMHVLGFTQ